MQNRLADLVEHLGGQLKGDPTLEISGVAGLADASVGQISFLSNPKLRPQATACSASALILSTADDAAIGPAYAGARIVTDNPYAYFARVAQRFDAAANPPRPGAVHARACVDASAQVDAAAWIGPNVVIDAGAVVGAGAIIDAGCYVGRGAVIGAGTHLHANVTFEANCRIGQRGIVHAGAVIGADGFGFANDAGAWVKIPQSGGVLIGDDVEIGANTCIDRGTLSDTVIEDGVKLDNQIQIGHNCHIGAHTAMAGCVGVAGSARIGKYCTVGGAGMISGHLTIADHTHVSAGTLVMRSITEPGQYTGFYPLAKHADWEKSAVSVRNLVSMRERIRALETTLKKLSEKNNE